MKQKLSNLIKTSRPLKNKVTDLIEDNLSLNDGGFSKLSIFPLKTKLPNIDSAQIEGNEPKITFNKEESPESSRETKQISDSYRSIDIVDDTRKMLENILNTSIINRNNSKNNITNIVEGTKNKNSVENVFNKNNMNSVENVFNRNDMNSLIKNIS